MQSLVVLFACVASYAAAQTQQPNILQFYTCQASAKQSCSNFQYQPLPGTATLTAQQASCVLGVLNSTPAPPSPVSATCPASTPCWRCGFSNRQASSPLQAYLQAYRQCTRNALTNCLSAQGLATTCTGVRPAVCIQSLYVQIGTGTQLSAMQNCLTQG